jgi:hypothetical protein
MAGFQRVHGSPASGGFYGYQPVILKIAGTGVGTADTVDGNGNITAEGNFGKSLRAIQERASIVFVGTRADNQFVVMIDGPTANAYNGANDDTSITAAIDAVVTAGLGGGISVTVTDISGLVAGNLA